MPRTKLARTTAKAVKRKPDSGSKTQRQKTSVYLDAEQRRRLVRLAKRTGRKQSELIREAIERYEPFGGSDRNFALAGGFSRIDEDPRPISEIPEAELLRGFGE